MNYIRLYNNIIKNRLNNPVSNCYTEKHHILPRSLGGNNEQSNIVSLLAREHFICHLLLTKIYKEGTSEWIKMVNAFMRMYCISINQQRYSNNKWYEYLKVNFSKVQSLNQSGNKNSRYNTCWITNINERKCISIDKSKLNEYLEKGWVKKRIINWETYDKCKNKKEKRKEYIKLREQNNKYFYEEAYNYYNEHGWKKTKEKYNLVTSWTNFVQQCKKYCTCFESKNHTSYTRGNKYK